MGPGQYGDSRFYPSLENFHLFKTCNVWVAETLRAAGLDVSPLAALGTESLFVQARPYGRTIQP
jgi:hypothetical protein